MASAVPTRIDRKLQLKEVLDWLVADGLLDEPAASKLLQDNRFARGGPRHPFVVIAEARLRSKAVPNAVLTPDSLTEWLAARIKMAFYRIDPLKIGLKSVTQVM